jgi:hypothetical protein
MQRYRNIQAICISKVETNTNVSIKNKANVKWLLPEGQVLK